MHSLWSIVHRLEPNISVIVSSLKSEAYGHSLSSVAYSLESMLIVYGLQSMVKVCGVWITLSVVYGHDI